MELSFIRHAHLAVLATIENLSASDLEFRPTPKSRSAAELLVHMYSAQAELAQALQPSSELPVLRAHGVSQIREYIQDCHEFVVSNIERPEVSGIPIIPSGFGTRSALMADIKELIVTEQFHHRGQLFTYLEMMGKKLPDIYAYRAGAPDQLQRR